MASGIGTPTDPGATVISRSTPAGDLCRAVSSSAESFQGGTAQVDDMTVVVVSVR